MGVPEEHEDRVRGHHPRPTREIIPSATFSRDHRRATPSEWDQADNDGDLGLSVKWGLSSTVTLDATVNPDFSQVESDAFQVEVNQRFPIFSEKRPFFMEGAGLFNWPATGRVMPRCSTRCTPARSSIRSSARSSPARWDGSRSSLTAIDQAPGRTETELDPLHGREKLFQVARAQMSLNAGSFAGAMATITELAGRTNLTGGADLSLNFKGSNHVNGFVIGSNTTGGDDSGSGSGRRPTTDSARAASTCRRRSSTTTAAS